MINNIFKNTKGFILIEVLVAIAIFVLFSSAMVSMILGALAIVSKNADYSYAMNLSQEGLEAVKSIQKKAWNEFPFDKSSIEFQDEWILSGENTESLVGKFRRYIVFEPVYRDLNGALLLEDNINSIRDINTLKAVSNVFWLDNKELSVSSEMYLSNWESVVWEQVNWSGGDGQEYYFEENKYFTKGNIRAENNLYLEEIATTTLANEGYLESSSFGPVNIGIFSVLSWEDEINNVCVECLVKVQIKTAPDINGLPGIWSSNWLGPKNTGERDDFFTKKEGELINKINNGNKWIKYRVTLLGDGQSSPEFRAIKIYYK